MKFNDLFVGDTINFASYPELGTCIISSYQDPTEGQIKILFCSNDGKCYPVVEGEEFKHLSTEIMIPYDTEVDLVSRRDHTENVFDAISYQGNKIVYSSEKDNMFITKEQDHYNIYEIDNCNIILISNKCTSYEDALLLTYAE